MTWKEVIVKVSDNMVTVSLVAVAPFWIMASNWTDLSEAKGTIGTVAGVGILEFLKGRFKSE